MAWRATAFARVIRLKRARALRIDICTSSSRVVITLSFAEHRLDAWRDAQSSRAAADRMERYRSFLQRILSVVWFQWRATIGRRLWRRHAQLLPCRQGRVCGLAQSGLILFR